MGPSGFLTARARQDFIQIGIRLWVAGGPSHRSLQGCRVSGFVQPALIVWNHCGGANDPDTRLGLFHQKMAGGWSAEAMARKGDDITGYRNFRAAPMAELA